MQIFRRLRHPVAAFSLTLACLVAQQQAFARSEEANLIRIHTDVLVDTPSGVRGDLLKANDGNIYFAASTGGATSHGFIGKVNATGTISTLYAFPDPNIVADAAVQPFGGVIQATDGNLYGTTFIGGVQGAGAIFRLTLDGQYTLLRSLGASKTDASLPYTGLVQASDGNLYGTTLRGGDNDKGTVFRISLSGSDFAIIHSFTGTDGENPEGALIVGSDGLLYGTTLLGGSANRGTIYRITLAGSLTSLYSFETLSTFNSSGISINATGANPRAALLLAADGNYYGTTYQGGPGGNGTVFRMTPDGVVSVFHAFTGPRLDGGFPLAGLTQDAAGNFYGTTQTGGYQDVGTAWRLSSSGQFSLLHGFVDSSDGVNPYATLLPTSGGIYGATFGSTAGSGTIFKLDFGSNGVLPVQLSVSPADAICISNTLGDCGATATITWSSPTAVSCIATGSWANGTTTTSGTQAVTLTSAGNYTYALSCTDGAGVERNAYASLAVSAPPLETVDGGGGAGALSVPLLLLLAVLLFRKKFKETFTACP